MRGGTMKVFNVDAQRSPDGVWVLECKELGVVSQPDSLDRAEDEVREAVAFQSGLAEGEFKIKVTPMEP